MNANVTALKYLPWFYQNEDISAIKNSIIILGCLNTNGKVSIKTSYLSELQNLWNHIVDNFPHLPWELIEVYEGSWEWPRAVSFPGAIAISYKLSINSPKTIFLYMVHEIVHQWIGIVLAPPRVPEMHQQMENLVDAYSWYVCESVYPELDQIFISLYTRHNNKNSIKEKNSEIYRIYRNLRNKSDFELQLYIKNAVEKIFQGERIIFNQSEIRNYYD